MSSLMTAAAPIVPPAPSAGLSFSYGTIAINDIQVVTDPHPSKAGRRLVKHVLVHDEPVEPTDRFWTSLATRFSEYGVSKQLFNLYDHDEVFNRLAERAGSDRLQYTIERNGLHAPKLLAAIAPEKPKIGYEQLMDILVRFNGQGISYMDGMVNSMHTPSIGSSSFEVACPYGIEESHTFSNRFMVEVAIDGYGKPVVLPSLERIDDGAMVVTRKAGAAFKQELNLGKGMDVVGHAIARALDSFYTDEGYANLRNRVEEGRKSWASVNEANEAYKLLIKQVSAKHVLGPQGTVEEGSPAVMEFHGLTGDTSKIWGMADMDAMAKKKQQNLPVSCTIYTLMMWMSATATHRCNEAGRQALQSYVGGLLSSPPFDLESMRNTHRTFQDFFNRTRVS